ncbi:hypothetical protein V6Z12_A02G054100 [Gossypium hirsutum]
MLRLVVCLTISMAKQASGHTYSLSTCMGSCLTMNRYELRMPLATTIGDGETRVGCWKLYFSGLFCVPRLTPAFSFIY